ncbi:MAG: primosomal protein N' [Rhodocyclaceae bacterium]|nr:primosomal protein N' [Rhodocyclaceae bacterium]
MPIVRVALPVPLPQAFDYLSENASTGDVGRSVRVRFGKEALSGIILSLPAHSDVAEARLKPVLEIRRDLPPLPPDWLAMVAFVARYYHAPIGEVVQLALPPGMRRSAAVDGRDPDPLLAASALGRATASDGHRAKRALAALATVLSHGSVRRSTLRAELGSAAPITDAMRRGWIETVAAAAPGTACGELPLTTEQGAAIDAIESTPPGFVCWLLHGVTGSGKTEVYLQLARHHLGRGHQVLMLVPEIALTPQLEARVSSRFPHACVVALHSAQSDGARSRGFLQAMDGRADIVLGTRLAVFTPMPRLGLIVVDEEHDASYAQLEGVRYSARDLAVWRARERDVVLVLGSATPSLESWQHAALGRYRRLDLRQRALAAALPAMRCIDTRRLRLDQGLSPPLLDAIDERLGRAEQSLVFLNRRGYAPVLSCPSCGWISGCDQCSANRVLHLAESRMRCHHCGACSAVPRACPQCGNQDIHAFGRGTQRLEHRLGERFPTARVLRIDRDAVRSRNEWERCLAAIAGGEVDIIVGTQMMAKGHDFPRLTLVGVVGADTSLHAADFRAPERLFQQLMQVGGRAGRAALAGQVLIQTEFPDHPLYAALLGHDYHRFAAIALDERRRAGFPPFAHQAMLRADAPQLDEAIDFLRQARALACRLATPEIQVFDPVPMRLVRLARRERAQLLVESIRRPALQGFLDAWVAALYREPSGRRLRWRIDVDPIEV